MTTSESAVEPRLRARLADGSLTGQWTLDPARSSVGLFNKSMGGLFRVRGTFRELSGGGTIAPDGAATGTLTIASASIDTKNKKRDEHLRSADFLDSATYPDIVFTAQRVAVDSTGATVQGTLSIHGTDRPFTFPAQVSAPGDEVHLDAEVVVDRSDFGITWNRAGMGSMQNTMTIHAVFVRR
ncbi:YceI family protein [Streptomyces cellulosae]|uniref:YceI family protein n=1 Tax=Streptomyces cellulosae TaxID=1968 RepID=UPI001F3777F8|nr:YceI family protein [Streptomyces cellulosae]